MGRTAASIPEKTTATLQCTKTHAGRIALRSSHHISRIKTQMKNRADAVAGVRPVKVKAMELEHQLRADNHVTRVAAEDLVPRSEVRVAGNQQRLICSSALSLIRIVDRANGVLRMVQGVEEVYAKFELGSLADRE